LLRRRLQIAHKILARSLVASEKNKMKNLITILLIFCGINLFGQNLDVVILSEKEALNIIVNQGLNNLERYTQPINLVYLNENNAKSIIDKEFSTNLIKPHQDSLGISVCHIPTYSIEIATDFKNEYALEKIFQYYKSLPKHIKSDTIYNAYIDLDDILALLVFYKPNGLVEVLESDYYKWRKLAKKTSPKEYKTIEEYRQESATKNLNDLLKLKPEDFIVDCNFISFQIAGALNKLGHKDFSDDFLMKLKLTQTYPFISNYQFPTFHNQDLDEHLFKKDYELIRLITNYTNIISLIKDPKKLEKLLYSKVENCCDSELFKILHDDKQRAYVEFSRNNGSDAYVIELEDDKLLIQEIWSIIE